MFELHEVKVYAVIGRTGTDRLKGIALLSKILGRILAPKIKNQILNNFFFNRFEKVRVNISLSWYCKKYISANDYWQLIKNCYKWHQTLIIKVLGKCAVFNGIDRL